MKIMKLYVAIITYAILIGKMRRVGESRTWSLLLEGIVLIKSPLRDSIGWLLIFFGCLVFNRKAAADALIHAIFDVSGDVFPGLAGGARRDVLGDYRTSHGPHHHPRGHANAHHSDHQQLHHGGHVGTSAHASSKAA